MTQRQAIHAMSLRAIVVNGILFCTLVLCATHAVGADSRPGFTVKKYRPTQIAIPASDDVTLYIGPNGSDSNIGTNITAPLATMQTAIARLNSSDPTLGHHSWQNATCTIYFLPGSYACNTGRAEIATTCGQLNILRYEAQPGEGSPIQLACCARDDLLFGFPNPLLNHSSVTISGFHFRVCKYALFEAWHPRKWDRQNLTITDTAFDDVTSAIVWYRGILRVDNVDIRNIHFNSLIAVITHGLRVNPPPAHLIMANIRMTGLHPSSIDNMPVIQSGALAVSLQTFDIRNCSCPVFATPAFTTTDAAIHDWQVQGGVIAPRGIQQALINLQSHYSYGSLRVSDFRVFDAQIQGSIFDISLDQDMSLEMTNVSIENTAVFDRSAIDISLFSFYTAQNFRLENILFRNISRIIRLGQNSPDTNGGIGLSITGGAGLVDTPLSLSNISIIQPTDRVDRGDNSQGLYGLLYIQGAMSLQISNSLFSGCNYLFTCAMTSQATITNSKINMTCTIPSDPSTRPAGDDKPFFFTDKAKVIIDHSHLFFRKEYLYPSARVMNYIGLFGAASLEITSCVVQMDYGRMIIINTLSPAAELMVYDSLIWGTAPTPMTDSIDNCLVYCASGQDLYFRRVVVTGRLTGSLLIVQSEYLTRFLIQQTIFYDLAATNHYTTAPIISVRALGSSGTPEIQMSRVIFQKVSGFGSIISTSQSTSPFSYTIENTIFYQNDPTTLALVAGGIAPRFHINGVTICYDEPPADPILSCSVQGTITGSLSVAANLTGGCLDGAPVLPDPVAGNVFPTLLCEGRAVNYSFAASGNLRQDLMAGISTTVNCEGDGHLETYVGKMFGYIYDLANLPRPHNSHPSLCPQSSLSLTTSLRTDDDKPFVLAVSSHGHGAVSYNASFKDKGFLPNATNYLFSTHNKVSAVLTDISAVAQPLSEYLPYSQLQIESKFLGIVLYPSVHVKLFTYDQLHRPVAYSDPTPATLNVKVRGRGQNVTVRGAVEGEDAILYEFNPCCSGRAVLYVISHIGGEEHKTDEVKVLLVWRGYAIAAGASLGVLILGLVLFFVHRRYRKKSSRLEDQVAYTMKLLEKQEGDCELMQQQYLRQHQANEGPVLFFLDRNLRLHLVCECPGHWHVVANSSITIDPAAAASLRSGLSELYEHVDRYPTEGNISDVSSKARLLTGDLPWFDDVRSPPVSIDTSAELDIVNYTSAVESLLSTRWLRMHGCYVRPTDGSLSKGSAPLLCHVQLHSSLHAWVCPQHREEMELEDVRPYDLDPAVAKDLSPVGESNPDVSVLDIPSIASLPKTSPAFSLLQVLRDELGRTEYGRSMRITRVKVLSNPRLENSFRERDRVLSLEGRGDLKQPVPPTYSRQRRATLEELARIETSYEYDRRDSGLHLCWHGAVGGEESVLKIAQTGFASLSMLNNGWYGRGIYTTHYPEYANYYTCDHKTKFGERVLLLSWALLGSAFPVVQRLDRVDDAEHQFHGGYPGYDSHYVLVLPGGSPLFHTGAKARKKDGEQDGSAEQLVCAIPDEPYQMGHAGLRKEASEVEYQGAAPSSVTDDSNASQTKPAHYDEIVVWQESQLLPRYVVYYTTPDDDT